MTDRRPVKVFLFDIDGTLLMAGGCGRISFVDTWTEVFGEGHPFDSVNFIGRTDTSVFAKGFEEVFGREPTQDETNRFFDAYHLRLARNVANAPRFRILPGVPEMLHGLTAGRDCIVGLVTGNTTKGAAIKLERAGLDHFFSCCGSGSDSPDRPTLTAIAIKRARDLAGGKIDVTVIGDSLLDAAAGRANGTRILLVASGGTPSGVLAASNPDVILDGFGDWENGLAALKGIAGGLRAGTDEVDRAAAIVKNNGVIIYPTSTLYGIGGNGLEPAVADRIRNIKNRSDASFILLAADVESALALAANVPPKAAELAGRFWPGPLTLVLPAAAHVPAAVQGPHGTVAVRVDAHPFTRALAAASGCPIISTSVNLSGEPAAVRASEVDWRLAAASDIFVVEEPAETPPGLPSTIVSFDNNQTVVLRQGAIPGEQL